MFCCTDSVFFSGFRYYFKVSVQENRNWNNTLVQIETDMIGALAGTGRKGRWKKR